MPARLDPETVVIDNGRSESYAAHLRDMAAKGLCPLDITTFREIGSERILYEVDDEENGWVLARNLEPYANTAEHLLFFPKRHLTSPSEMTVRDKLIVWDLFDYACDELGLAYGGLFMRYSTNEMHPASGATLAHLHGQIVMPVINPETGRAPGWQPGSPTPDAHAVMVKIG
ncbi:MAG TPA: hypothetical protein VL737_02495 [Candidatus Pristimantibacillus sp.]|nr:hypothetical protein [Candidatus Pristimantibacillus sp.]